MATPKISLSEDVTVTLKTAENLRATPVHLHLEGKVDGLTEDVMIAGKQDLRPPEGAGDDWKPDFPASHTVTGPAARFIADHQIKSMRLAGLQVEVTRA